jgi:hypothetical protein
VRKLRKMIGRDHPDVEALSFRCQDPTLAHRGSINAAPMFNRSWRIILEAASSRHKLMPLDLWKRTMAAGTMPPYLMWSMQNSAKEKRLRNLRKAAAEHLSSRFVEIWPQPSPIAERTPSASIESAPSAAVEPDRSASMAPEPRTKKSSRHEIALDLRVPANVLLHLIAPSKGAGKAIGLAAGKAAAKARTAKKVGSKRKSASGKGKTGGKRIPVQVSWLSTGSSDDIPLAWSATLANLHFLHGLRTRNNLFCPFIRFPLSRELMPCAGVTISARGEVGTRIEFVTVAEFEAQTGKSAPPPMSPDDAYGGWLLP